MPQPQMNICIVTAINDLKLCNSAYFCYIFIQLNSASTGQSFDSPGKRVPINSILLSKIDIWKPSTEALIT